MSESISVIMGVYNEEKTIELALDSLFKQTYSDWNLIVCDDASVDNSFELLSKYRERYPSKIILLKNEMNFGLAYTLNRCLEHVTTQYVARMDGDDISHHDRFAKQVKYLRKYKDVDLVGTAMQRFNEFGLADIVLAPSNPDMYTMKGRTPFNHATIMTYSNVFFSLDGYTVAKRTDRCEDLDLWFRFFHKGFKGANIMEPLYYVREDINSIKRRTFKSRLAGLSTIFFGYRLLNFPKRWYVKPAVTSVIKGVTPSIIQYMYRKYQKHNYRIKIQPEKEDSLV